MDEISSLLQGDLLSENPEQAVSSFGRHRVITDRWKGMNRDQLMAIRYSQQQQVLEKLVFKLTCIFCIPGCNNIMDSVCRRKYYCLPCTLHYNTVFSIDLNFTQTLINQTEQCLWSSWEMSWSSRNGLEPWSWARRKVAVDPRAKGPGGSWGMVHGVLAEEQDPAQPKTLVQFRTGDGMNCLQGMSRSVLLHMGRRARS